MLADAAAPASCALRASLAMLADAAATASCASRVLLAMLADAAATASCALRASPAMLTDAAAPASCAVRVLLGVRAPLLNAPLYWMGHWWHRHFRGNCVIHELRCGAWQWHSDCAFCRQNLLLKRLPQRAVNERAQRASKNHLDLVCELNMCCALDSNLSLIS